MTRDHEDDILDLDRSVEPNVSAEDIELHEIADLLWEAEQGAPPLQEDPVAAMLGLVPNPSYALDPVSMKRARKAANLGLSDLADRLTARGWKVDKSDIYRWENRSTGDVAPALIKALAEETGVDPDRLATRHTMALPPQAVTDALASPLFVKLANRWAKLQNVTLDLARSELESRMLSTVYRGEHANAEEMLQSLGALLEAAEGAETS